MNNRLGKGIEALIRTRDLSNDQYVDGFIDLDKIKVNPNQPRKYFDEKLLNELVESIKEKGILQPITIKKLNDNSFELIAGERRFRAAKILKLKTIPAYIIKVDSDIEKLELALVENIQRNDLNVIEEAEAYHVLKEKYDLTHQEIAKRVGKGRVEITRTMELIKLPDNIKQSLIENFSNPDFSFSRGHARTILSIKDPLKIQSMFNRIVQKKLSVRETERLVKKINQVVVPARGTINKESSLLNDEKSLSGVLKTKVEILNKKNNSGHIKISFKSKKERLRIIDEIKSSKTK